MRWAAIHLSDGRDATMPPVPCLPHAPVILHPPYQKILGIGRLPLALVEDGVAAGLDDSHHLLQLLLLQILQAQELGLCGHGCGGR